MEVICQPPRGINVPLTQSGAAFWKWCGISDELPDLHRVSARRTP